jgi:hypothetical protein
MNTEHLAQIASGQGEVWEKTRQIIGECELALLLAKQRLRERRSAYRRRKLPMRSGSASELRGIESTTWQLKTLCGKYLIAKRLQNR